MYSSNSNRHAAFNNGVPRGVAREAVQEKGSQMVVSGACFSPGCQNPVIGQCPGHGKTCLRFYCAAHSTDGLCSECANRKHAEQEAQRIYQDYLKTAEGLFVPGCGTQIALFSLGFGIMIGITALCPAAMKTDNLVPLLIVVGICLAPSLMIRSYLNSQSDKQARAISRKKPHFYEFFQAYRKEKLRETRDKSNKLARNTLLFTLAAAAAGAAVATEAQLYDDVHTIRKKLDQG
ncbi:MAG: hypothetical protein JNL42_16730 [Anaerolineae bacterium]|nr:hypothetical protein [Anaerolineae bacterium]